MPGFKTLERPRAGKLPNPKPPSNKPKDAETVPVFPTPDMGAGVTLGYFNKSESSCWRISCEGEAGQKKICLCRWDFSNQGWFPVCYTTVRLDAANKFELAHWLQYASLQ